MAQQLTAAQKVLLDVAEVALEEAFKNGCEYPPGTNIVPAIEGYTSLESVNGVDIRPQAKGVFKAAIAAFMAATEDWHLVGTGGNPSFGSGWTNYNAGYNPVAFYRDAFNRVHLRGLVAVSGGPASGTIFTLPDGYRPPYTELRVQQGYSGGYVPCRIDVDTAGAVFLVNPSTIASWVSLDGLSFRVA